MLKIPTPHNFKNTVKNEAEINLIIVHNNCEEKKKTFLPEVHFSHESAQFGII